MHTRLHQVLGFVAVLTASATASSPVLSADLPPAALPPAYAEPLPPQDVFEGWYLGGTIGGATVSYDFAPAGGTADTSGVLGGVVGGYSWQSGPFVLGVEGDIMAADIDGRQSLNSGYNQVNPSIDTMADLRLRAESRSGRKCSCSPPSAAPGPMPICPSPASAAGREAPISSAGALAAAPRSPSRRTGLPA